MLLLTGILANDNNSVLYIFIALFTLHFSSRGSREEEDTWR